MACKAWVDSLFNTRMTFSPPADIRLQQVKYALSSNHTQHYTQKL